MTEVVEPVSKTYACETLGLTQNANVMTGRERHEWVLFTAEVRRKALQKAQKVERHNPVTIKGANLRLELIFFYFFCIVKET